MRSFLSLLYLLSKCGIVINHMLFASLAVAALAAVRLEMHFMSLCKQCQIHIAATNDMIWNGGLELAPSVAGVRGLTNFSIDYYGPKSSSGQTCEAASSGTEHGPDQCVNDRYHLCAQHADPPEPKWFNYVHCMWMNIDVLKCGHNGHCNTSTEYVHALGLIHPMCATLTGVDAAGIAACAHSERGMELARKSYAHTHARTAGFPFAPAFVDGTFVDGADQLWRKTPDQLHWGRAVLDAVCKAAAARNVSAPPPLACS